MPIPLRGAPPWAPYRALLALPSARLFTAAGAVARLPAAMCGVSTVLLVARAHGSYGLAGAVSAAGLLATALAGPWTARLTDRHGQRRVAPWAAALAALGLLGLVLCVRGGAPVWTYFATYPLLGCAPNTGAMARARWAHLLRKPEDPGPVSGGSGTTPEDSGPTPVGPRPTPQRSGPTPESTGPTPESPGPTSEGSRLKGAANALEQVIDELCFTLGPVLAVLLATSFDPAAGLLTAAGLLLGGTLAFVAVGEDVRPAPGAGSAAGRLPWRGLAPLLCCFVGTGVVFGSLEVTTVSGTGGAAGLLLGVQAAGSGLAGLALGACGRPLRLGRCLAVMAALLLFPPLCAATTDAAWPLAPALLLIGTATAPVMITAMNTLHSRVPARRLTEAMSWAVTAILAGSSAGATAAGHLADGPRPWLGYTLPPLAAAGAWLAVRAGSRTRQAPPRTPRPSTPPAGPAPFPDGRDRSRAALHAPQPAAPAPPPAPTRPA
ncbi:MFS transporter permease [Streptomyces sp. NRRL F-5630]|uniref:MFS transporter permease n=1 Tax=Streptomyces sp. NRRL F-5630 TaxID=1463864 RepID=UPI00068DD267|nr:MFS transporter permease [Streptomyces sp. NRRL F-5630]